MNLPKSQTGFTAIHILLFLVIVGIIGFAGWKVYDANKTLKSSATISTIQSSDKTKPPETMTIPVGFVEYQDKDHGFKFAYPKEWGDAKAYANNRIGFSSNNKVVIKVVSKNEPVSTTGAGDGDNCAGNPQVINPADVKVSGQFVNDSVHESKTYSAFLDKGTDFYVYESYEYYPTKIGFIGMCPGYTISGAKVFNSNAKLIGLAFDWYQYGSDCCTVRPSQVEYDAFVKDKNSVLGAGEKQKIVEVVQSIKEL